MLRLWFITIYLAIYSLVELNKYTCVITVPVCTKNLKAVKMRDMFLYLTEWEVRLLLIAETQAGFNPSKVIFHFNMITCLKQILALHCSLTPWDSKWR